MNGEIIGICAIEFMLLIAYLRICHTLDNIEFMLREIKRVVDAKNAKTTGKGTNE